MKHESKTIHVDERPSFSGSLVTIFAEQGSRTAEGKTSRENLPGKSRVGRILLNDNNSQNRMLGMRLADIHQMRRKAETFISHQQKTFIANMEKRQDSWVREHERFSSSTNLVLPPGEQRIPVTPPMRSPTKTPRAQESRNRASKCGESHPVDQGGEGGTTSLPTIAYLTEDSEKAGDNCFMKPPDININRPARMMVGLPPIIHARKTGFAPSGNIDELSDDKALRRKKRGTDIEGKETPNAHFLPTIDPANANQPPGDNESQNDVEDDDKIEEEPDERGPTPLLVLSRSLPRIQMNAPQTRKFRARHGQRTKIRRKRSRGLEEMHDADDPLGDERYTKLRELLSSDAAADHETRDLDALADGLIAAKRFGRNWKT